MAVRVMVDNRVPGLGMSATKQRITIANKIQLNEAEAYQVVELPTKPKGVYDGIDTVEKHQKLVNFMGGGIHFPRDK